VRKLLLPVLCGLALAACDSGGGEDREPARGASPPDVRRATGDGRVESGEIRAGGLREHLRALQRIADDHGGDRAAGTPGDRASVEYVVRRLREAGWRVRRQPFAFPYFDERSPPRVRAAGGRALREGEEFRTMTYSGSGRVEGAVRRVGLGCRRGDFRDVREGEVAVAARGDCFFRVKARNAESAGAAALLVVDADSDEPPSATLGAPGTRIPAVGLGAAAGRALGRRVTVQVDAVSERRRSSNVIAETAGGPSRAVAMAGGHLDSVPAGAGINDNGSGVAALLVVADALGGRAPGARIRLAFWGAEELGLIGSRRYVRRLGPEERERVAGYLNLDMVGSPNPKRGVYSDGDPAMERLLRRLIGPDAEEENAGGRSDHAPFDRAGIPVGGLFTGAGRPNDPCYHRACDDLDNVDMPVLVEMARAAGEAMERLSARR
jgi:Iap family predicted aminopeptidase